jgi:four helix bundle protein
MRNIILDKSFDFAVEIVKYSKVLKKSNDYELARQIVRSGTSIAANITESQQAESTKDFIHKLSIALKETSETILWLKIIYSSEIDKSEKNIMLTTNAEEIKKILTSIIKTTKSNQKKKMIVKSN